ncbi:response regulator transcription factor [Nocardioides cavernaquae]|uniref:DNA-binding response regulator n=1 Tax=Nocardioides cavernaquae TaxID=2321396 RepID=A0A3A5H6F1_9ACTN|nr:response regulator transcription factor [Nocardioides cavernaquae]RJS46266.1 DNA-binding response regulator [Nocardioides cavernaquae]
MQTTAGQRLLLLEDDDSVAVPLLRALQREGYAVQRVASGAEGLAVVAAGGVDLVLLDLGLPDIDGLEVCRQLRADGYDGGILMLTGRDSELDRVDGLDVGADDYLPKPFGLAELFARTRALLRRTRPAASSTVATAGGAARASTPGEDGTVLQIDPSARRAWVAGSEVGLTEKEFDLLNHLASQPGVVARREELMDAVWDENWFGSTKTLDVTVARLRVKLEGQGLSSAVVTVRGVGFRLEADDVRVL